jgi:hypothetical protein
MHIKYKLKDSCFRFFWIKYVVDFNPEVHCAPCLVGSFEHLPFRAPYYPINTPFTIDTADKLYRYVYVCGVTGQWARNFHLALEESPGGRVEIETTDIKIHAQDARALQITPMPTDKPPEFSTCRNYQFGLRYLADISQAASIHLPVTPLFQ